jgi:hypothetical protein
MKETRRGLTTSLAILCAGIVVILGRLLSGAPAQETDTRSQQAVPPTVAASTALVSFYRDGVIDTGSLANGVSGVFTVDSFSEPMMFFDQARTGTVVYTRRDRERLESEFIYYRDPGRRGVILDNELRGCRFPSISPDGEIILCVKGGVVYRYDWQDNRFRAMPLKLADDTPARAAGAPQVYNSVIVVPVMRGEEPQLALFEAQDGSYIKLVRNTSAVFSDSGRRYATPDDLQGLARVMVWDLDTRLPAIVAMPGFLGKTTALAFGGQPEMLLVSVQDDDMTHVVWVNWRQSSYSAVHTFDGPVPLLADISPESDILLTRQDTGTVLYLNPRAEDAGATPVSQARAARWVQYPY